MLDKSDKMFKEKPYSQCSDCIQSRKLKCKKCMAVIVEDIFANRNKTILPQAPLSKTSSKFVKKPQQKEEYLASSNFELWIEKLREKRTKDYDVVSSTLSKWPHKIARKNRNKIDKVQQPRFQIWESRLKQRLSNSSSHLHLLEKNPR